MIFDHVGLGGCLCWNPGVVVLLQASRTAGFFGWLVVVFDPQVGSTFDLCMLEFLDKTLDLEIRRDWMASASLFPFVDKIPEFVTRREWACGDNTASAHTGV